MSSQQDKCLLTINLPPALEDNVVDWLLASDLDQGFTSYRADGHGSAHDQLSIDEQVRGRQRRLELRLVLDRSRLDDLVGSLRKEFSGADIFYYVLPVLDASHLGASHLGAAG